VADSVVDILLRVRQQGAGLADARREVVGLKADVDQVDRAADKASSSLDDLVSIEKIKAFAEILKSAFQSLDDLAQRNIEILRLADGLGVTTERAQALGRAAKDTGASVEALNAALSDDAIKGYTEQADLFGATVGPEAAQATRDWKQSTSELSTVFGGIGNSLLGPVSRGIELFVDGMSIAGITIDGIFKSIAANWSGWAESFLIQVRTTMQQATNLMSVRSPQGLRDALAANAAIGRQGSILAGQAAGAGFAAGGAALAGIQPTIGAYLASQAESRAAIREGTAGTFAPGGGGGGGRAGYAGGWTDIGFEAEDAATEAERRAMQAAGQAAQDAEARRYASTTKDGRGTGAPNAARGGPSALGVAGALAGGDAMGVIGMINPIAGAVAGALGNLGSMGADAVLGQIKDQIGGILSGITELPAFVVGLVAELPAILIGLVKALLFELPVALAKALADLPRMFAESIAEALGIDGGGVKIDENSSGRNRRGTNVITIGGAGGTQPAGRKAAGA